MGQRAFRLSEILQHVTEVHAGLSETGVEAESSFEFALRLFQPARGLEDHSQAVMERRNIAPNRNRAKHQLERGVRLAGFIGQHARKMQGIGVGGVEAQDLLIDGLRLGPTAGLLVCEGRAQSFNDGGHIPSICSDPFHHGRPVSGVLLPEQSHGRVPGSVFAFQQPSKTRSVGE